MRILHLGTLYPPHLVGGAERSVGLLADEQVRQGHDVAAACLSPSGWVREARHGVSVFRMPHENDFWMEDWPRHGRRAREWAKFKQQGNRAAEANFARVIDEFRPDLVNTHSLVDVTTLVWRAAKRAGVPIVHTLRDYDLLCAASSMYRESGPCTRRHLKCRILTFCKGFDQAHVDAVTAVGREVLDRHLAAGFFAHVPANLRQVIWNAVEGGRGVRRAAAADEPFTFGYLGRISPEKGVDTLLDALAHLPPDGWRLRIAGVAADGGAAIRARAAGLPVAFLGFVDPAALLGSVDVLVVPSLWAEPLGRTVLEAYHAGVPVIGSDGGGIAEVIADPAWLFPPGDAAALGRLMRRVSGGGRSRLPPDTRYAGVIAKTRPAEVGAAFARLYDALLRPRRAGTGQGLPAAASIGAAA